MSGHTCIDCGSRCLVCDERLCSMYGPVPAPTCGAHHECTDCATDSWCRDCRTIRADLFNGENDDPR